MPDTRSHRGPDPRDQFLFRPEALPTLREAVAELSWLLGRGYAEIAALKLVGDRHRLTDRQRMAVRRSACSDQARSRRLRHLVSNDSVRGQTVLIDGFNVLTTVEAALGGAIVLKGRDGAVRDLAGVHGTYRKVEETIPAVRILGDLLAAVGVAECVWYLDRPVSNSGRLKTVLRELAEERSWNWRIELVLNPDPILKSAEAIVATADAAILDATPRWWNLARLAVEARVRDAFVVDLEGCDRV